MNTNTVVHSPAEFAPGATLAITGASTGLTEQIIRKVRPDITFDPGGIPLFVDPALCASPPAAGLLFPEGATSYYDFWSFPLALLQTRGGHLAVEEAGLIEHIAGFGDFFGQTVDGRWQDSTLRCRVYDDWRPRPEDRLAVERLLGDDASRRDLAAVLDGSARDLRAHWLSQVFSGLEYMDYVSVRPGDVVINCGVHGGGEAPHFLAGLRGEGALVNVDPLGQDYMIPHVRAAVGAVPGRVHEVRAAIHSEDGSIDLPVEPGGMAAGGLPGMILEGLQTLTFEALTLETIARRLDLQRMDLVKTDVEGAEIAALDGAWATLRRFRPQLAISIYHQPSHFIDIPLRIAAELPGYKFFLRSYHFISNETILYAIPEERPIKPRNSQIKVVLA